MGEQSNLLSTIVGTSLRFRGTVVVLSMMLLGYGAYNLMHARYDVFPEFAPPQVVVQTEAPGLAPEQVEVLVTQPIENAINGVSGVSSIRSSSIQGLSIINVFFRMGSDIYRDRQNVSERLSVVASRLPGDVKPPVMTPLTSSTSVVRVIGMTARGISMMELRTIADWTVKPRLLAVPGVAKIAVFGGAVRQIQVQVLPEKLLRFDLSIKDVIAAARDSTGVLGAGFIDTANQRIVLETEGQSLTARQLSKTVLRYVGGAAVSLGDVARIVDGPEPPIGAALINGQPGVQLVVSAQYGANTLEVTRGLDLAIAGLGPALRNQGVTLWPDLFRPARFIRTAMHNMKTSLALGAVLVVGVLCLFLFNFRTAGISCTAIPLSLLGAMTILQSFGFSLNTMTLGGLAIAIGEVVDDAVIDVENILRRLKENASLPSPRPVHRVVLEASIEVRSAVVYATFTVILVFLPVVWMKGLVGRLFSPLGIAYILAILFSLLVALTVTPALCMTLLSRGDLEAREPPTVRWLKRHYKSLLYKVERAPRMVMSGVLLFTVAGLAMLPFFGGAFLPELREGHYILHVSAVPGTSLKESLRFGRLITRRLLKLPYVRSVSQRVGRAEKADDVWGTHYSEVGIDLTELAGPRAEKAPEEIRRILIPFSGLRFSLKTFLAERIEETFSGYTATVAVNIYGNDLDVLDRKAMEVSSVLGRLPGAIDVQVRSPPGTPRLVIRLRKADLLYWGIDPVEAMEAIRTAYQGEVAGQIYNGNRIFDVSVILAPEIRRDPGKVGSLPLLNADGRYVFLGQVADIYETAGRYAVLHQGARRVQTVTCNVSGVDLNTFLRTAKRAVSSSVHFPADTYVEFSGAGEGEIRSRQDLLVHSVLAGVFIILVLSMVFGGMRNLLLVLVNLPFALVGGILAVLFAGGWLSIGSIVGFVTLFGITLRNSIMMISHYEHLVSCEDAGWGLETAIRGASERLAPILMTALVTALGLLPLAIGSGAPGREIEGPMARVILGGLVTSTVLNLLVLPTLALRYGRFVKRVREDENE